VGGLALPLLAAFFGKLTFQLPASAARRIAQNLLLFSRFLHCIIMVLVCVLVSTSTSLPVNAWCSLHLCLY
jgi:hypothetical protein